jgi:hypothetical protein
MKRRVAVQQIAFLVGGAFWVPSCIEQSRQNSVEEEGILTDWVDWLIPETDTPGAKALRVDLFVSKMIEDCHDSELQKQFADDLQRLSKQAVDGVGKAWKNCTADQKKQVFDHFQNTGKAELASFDTVKRRTIQGYLSSEYVMTNIFKYEMAPGRYDGYFPITKKS